MSTRRFFIEALAMAAVLGGFGLLSTVGGDTAGSGHTGSYSHEQLQRDAGMTQQMSVPNASGPMEQYQTRDPQLDRAQDPAYVGALEQHQRDIDRMLARRDVVDP